jgi:hypothetical protein
MREVINEFKKVLKLFALCGPKTDNHIGILAIKYLLLNFIFNMHESSDLGELVSDLESTFIHHYSS